MNFRLPFNLVPWDPDQSTKLHTGEFHLRVLDLKFILSQNELTVFFFFPSYHFNPALFLYYQPHNRPETWNHNQLFLSFFLESNKHIGFIYKHYFNYSYSLFHLPLNQSSIFGKSQWSPDSFSCFTFLTSPYLHFTLYFSKMKISAGHDPVWNPKLISGCQKLLEIQNLWYTSFTVLAQIIFLSYCLPLYANIFIHHSVS